MTTDDQRRAFFERTADGPMGCLLWSGPKDRGGYGVFHFAGGRRLAHRVAYEMATGTRLEKTTVICHTCDVRDCVAVGHLFPGSVGDNNADMWAKGRAGGVAAAHASKASCVHGHPLSGENVRIERDGSRRCRTCARTHSKRNYWKRYAGMATA